jgi:protein-tyrosine phosphatase
LKKKGESNKFYIESAATSSEELGNPVYPPARRILERCGINCTGKTARRLTLSDYDKFDYIIGMDDMNVRDMKRLFGKDEKSKISKLLDFTDNPKDVADPWWTRDFEATYNDVINGINGFYKKLKEI